MDNSELDDLSDVGDWFKELATYAFQQKAKLITIRTASLQRLLLRLEGLEAHNAASERLYLNYKAEEALRHRGLVADVALGSAESIRTKQFQDAAKETFDMALSDEKKLERLKALLILLQMNLEAAYQRHNERP